MTRLYKEGVIGQQNYDDTKTQTLLIEANVENIKARLNRFKKSLKDTRVMAPIDGVVSERKVSVGEYVKVGAELFKIVDSNPLKLAFTIPENSAGEIKIGQKVQVQPRAFADKTFQGKIYFINPKVDIETRTVEVKAWVDNPEYTLKPGFYVNVKTLLEERKSHGAPGKLGPGAGRENPCYVCGERQHTIQTGYLRGAGSMARWKYLTG